jgi:pyrroloquinoline quinone (PQQ) biosynthesis protein C
MRESDFKRLKPEQASSMFFANLQSEIATHPVLTHRFLKRFSEERISREKLAAFAVQHYMYSRFFMRNLAGVISNVPDENARSLLILNMYEEIGEPLRVRDRAHILLLEQNLISAEDLTAAYRDVAQDGIYGDVVHALIQRGAVTRQQVQEVTRVGSERAGELTHPALFRRFLRALGISPAMVEATRPLPETTNMIETYQQVCREAHWLEAMGAMGPGTECVVSQLYKPIEDGLKASGVLTSEDYIFWTVHIVCDDGHGQNIIDAMAPFASNPENAAMVARGARRVLEARRRWFDGLERLVFGENADASLENGQTSLSRRPAQSRRPEAIVEVS